jgi:hypothetical protein
MTPRFNFDQLEQLLNHSEFGPEGRENCDLHISRSAVSGPNDFPIVPDCSNLEMDAQFAATARER